MYQIKVVLRDFDNNVLSAAPDSGTCTTFSDLEVARRFCATTRRGFAEDGTSTTVFSFTVRVDGGPARNIRMGAIL
jgi:hypothetical protein